jgi:hypothetical protein
MSPTACRSGASSLALRERTYVLQSAVVSFDLALRDVHPVANRQEADRPADHAASAITEPTEQVVDVDAQEHGRVSARAVA